jgi:hypothetical protein
MSNLLQSTEAVRVRQCVDAAGRGCVFLRRMAEGSSFQKHLKAESQFRELQER